MEKLFYCPDINVYFDIDDAIGITRKSHVRKRRVTIYISISFASFMTEWKRYAFANILWSNIQSVVHVSPVPRIYIYIYIGWWACLRRRIHTLVTIDWSSSPVAHPQQQYSNNTYRAEQAFSWTFYIFSTSLTILMQHHHTFSHARVRKKRIGMVVYYIVAIYL